ncbi:MULTISPECIES: 2-polyprenyl-3-methyl-6-methoxy-1,4-benzoquinone monooxygenase [Pandoraea]|jgi:ubiquinone biosynthesis monooxygenase Coq7|uniref:2-polyprenyl-3-methyl-6-methoxy-1,4-benzoquinone monooxygenase n=1 Tax=Pandoraea TaxID=93217 RepID=UPI0003C7547C|nr:MULTISPECIES: 2-polyprenyl-3-methyl-6-methoxy-1,4-benzoquinone monooxygenase [Pandoraea]AHB04222.1 2-octaprenyl-3-methyl-6-methoxy-1,4-benzoquinol hydroxylase [Pandoraea pnomenusa 3kgm]AHB75387.1 2-octaprenyl-3-methyl-6-methoxy-1,4-benzoquinol hydroxylase [Pandoraea pnomenusa]AHN76297.1 2-octaprenyl-3-methyl-6-methoxy-1,4-benzoquinol hydroxylase [Pandoraea pnomenusa]ANC44295.1 2-octaprenyl-3-methyl-6-methoxy-1,4-benzoquinol hydroxylase [Pandoraea pnomenusa]MBN9096305.1 2-polyprenyl-3-methyl
MFSDSLISELDRGLRAIAGVTRASRPTPVATTPSSPQDVSIGDDALTPQERRHVAGLMRVNHVGEVCAQALYQAQKLATKRSELRAAFEHAGKEEEDHLAWTAHRLTELGSRPSLLNPLWYAGAFAIGFVAGKCGDKVSLGFMSETERQVEHHLDGHLNDLPPHDLRSRAIVDQMRRDEIEHGQAARDAGGVTLPVPVQRVMRAAAKVMTTTAYYI